MAAKTPPKFEQARLQTMTEPFTVRVERVRGNTKSLIPLPPKEGYAVGGPGWTMEEVMGLEQWIVKDWSGGGTYLFSVTDSDPQPKTMEWSSVFNYPERNPPILADAGPPPPVLGQVQQPQQPSFASPGSSLPWPPPAQQWQGMPPVPQAQTPAAPAPWATSNPWGFPPLFPYGAPPTAPATPVKSSNDEVEKLRLQMMEERHRAEVSRREQEHAQQMAALQAEVRRLAEQTAQAAQRPAGPDPAILERLEREREERLKAERAAERAEWEAKIAAERAASAKPAGPDPELVALKAQMEADRRAAEEARRYEELRRQNEERERRMEAELRAIREDRNRGPDPMLMMIVDQIKGQAETQREIARLNAEAQKESARSNAEVVRELRTQMIHPSEMFRMYREASSGQDQIIRSTVNTLNDVFGTAQQWFQTMMQQMGGGGEHPAVRLIEGGMGQIKEMADRWFSTKAQTEVARANAAREAAKAQVAAYGGAAWQPPPPVQPQQIAGAEAGPGAPSPTPAQPTTPTPTNGASGPATQVPAPKKPSPLRSGGKTDEEWFGPALANVEELRQGAALFVKSMEAEPPDLDENGYPKGVGPDQAAIGIIQATHMIQQARAKGENVDVLAFSALFDQGMYPQLVDVLLPGIHPSYKEDMLHFLFGLMEGKSPEQLAKELEAKNGSAGETDEDEAQPSA